MIGIPVGMSVLSQGNPHRYLGSRGTLIGRRGTLAYSSCMTQGVLIFLESGAMLLGNTVVLLRDIPRPQIRGWWIPVQLS